MGFGTGFASNFKVPEMMQTDRANKQTMALEVAKMEHQTAKEKQEEFTKMGVSISETAKLAAESGSIDDPKMQQQLSSMIQQYVEVGKAYTEKGYLPQGAIQTGLGQITAAASIQTPSQKAESELVQEGKKTRQSEEIKQEFKGKSQKRLVSGNSELNIKYGLGIPAGETANVEFTEKDGQITASVESRFGTSQTINIGSGEKFIEESDKLLASRINDIVISGNAAVGTQQNAEQMAELLKSGTQTGKLQPAITSLQGIAADFGLDLSSIGSAIGVNIGTLSSKEEFDRLTKQVIVDGFVKFKGNLNIKEVEIAMTSFANMGRSEQANKEAIAALLASQEIARERGVAASNIDTKAEAKALEREIIGNDVAKFKKLKESFLKELTSISSREESVPVGIPRDAVKIKEENGKSYYQVPGSTEVWMDEP